MASALTIGLGAPGIYESPSKTLRTLTGVRMDVAGFAGVCPRGPARVPVVNHEWREDCPCVDARRPRRRTVAVPVESFEEYRRLFGGFEGPGLLPYAVAAFFEQGGRRAWVARIVHEYGNPADNSAGAATGVVPGARTPVGPLALRAREEGSWGNRLQASISFIPTPLDFKEPRTSGLTIAKPADCPVGTMLRLTLADASLRLRYVSSLAPQEPIDRAGVVWQACFDRAVESAPASAETVTATLVVQDGERVETHERLGLAAEHPRWMGTALVRESQLVYPDAAWAESSAEPSSPELSVPRAAPPTPGSEPAQFGGGADRYGDITCDDFFDDTSWSPSNEEPGFGVQCFAQIAELSTLVVPDLYSPRPLPKTAPVVGDLSLAGPQFARCVDTPQTSAPQTSAPVDLVKLRLDPASAADLAEIIRLQARLADFADQMGSFVVLLDVPPGLSPSAILRWRLRFDTSFAAAYHPWLRVADGVGDGVLIRLPPSAAAAGIIARQENLHGVPHGPANLIAAGAIDVEVRVDRARHDQLHQAGINVFLRERDGALLMGARTLSHDPAYRQLTVRRLMTMLRRTLMEKMQWAVFEPHTAALRAEIRLLLLGFLRQLHQAGAFAGASEEEAFFVRCDQVVNPPSASDTGRLVAEIGVAPSEPIEYLVLRLCSDADGRLTVEE